MPRKAAGLSAAKVKSAAPGRYGDGGGLYLLVRKNGTRFWIFRWVREGKMREMGLGPAGTATGAVSLAEARLAADAQLKLVRAGIDPLLQRDEQKAAAKAEAQERAIKAITFRIAAERYIEAHEAGWRNAKHAAQWSSTLKTYAHVHFGEVAVSDIGVEHVLAALEPIWREKPETAVRVRGRIESILDYARVRDWRTGENPARWKGHLQNLLPARSKVAKVEHHAALPWIETGSFMTALRGQAGVGPKALEFTILTASRTSEALCAPWKEIDLAQKVWTIPAERMKGGKEHRVPLSAPAITLLEEMAKLRTSARPDAPVFPGARPNKPLSNMALLMTLRRMKRGDITAHGFRSTFRDWAAERTGFSNEVVEMALSHAVADKVEAAYRRGDLFEKRRQVMADWATFCGQPSVAAGEVLAFRGERA